MDPAVLALVAKNRERLEDMHKQPYLDLTVWSPLAGWKLFVLGVLIVLALAAAAFADAVPEAGEIVLGVVGAVGVLVAVAWALASLARTD